jgi:hypothetical protein
MIWTLQLIRLVRLSAYFHYLDLCPAEKKTWTSRVTGIGWPPHHDVRDNNQPPLNSAAETMDTTHT